MGTNAINENEFRNPDIEIYGEKGPMTLALHQTLSVVYSKEYFDGTVFLALNGRDDETYLKKLLEKLKINPEQKLIIFGFLNITDHLSQESKKFIMKMVKYPNVRVVDDIFEMLPNTIKCLEELQKGESIGINSNNLRMSISSRIIGTLQHDLKPGVLEEKGERYHEIIKEAREVFEIKEQASDESVVEFIQNARTRVEKVMEGKEIGGVYCDIDDTIFDKAENLIPETLKIIEGFEKEGKEIIIWTGGDIEKARQRLSKTQYAKYRIVSKYDFAGAIAEVIIDNVSPDKFYIQTGITAKRFIRV